MAYSYNLHTYKGHTITEESFAFTLFWKGDELAFVSLKDAENFIDENT